MAGLSSSLGHERIAQLGFERHGEDGFLRHVGLRKSAAGVYSTSILGAPFLDHADPYTVFDIAGNHFRIITVIHYNRQKLYIREVFTHAEYDHWNKAQRSRKT